MNNETWLIYGVIGENISDVTLGRWAKFEDDATAEASTLYAGYTWAAIADAPRGKVRATWSQETGWQDAD